MARSITAASPASMWRRNTSATARRWSPRARRYEIYADVGGLPVDP